MNISIKPSVFSASLLVLLCFLWSSSIMIECESHDESIRVSAAALGDGSAADLELAASESNNLLTSESHKIIAAGWPSTSSMWPTIDIDDGSTAAGGNEAAAAAAANRQHDWFRMIEPFIYADKPRTGDYSLLLRINSTTLESLKAHLKPMSVSLSFEYYFNHDPKSTALPLIKIEVNRKEFKYLDPNGQNVRSRRWMKFNERIQIVDLQQLSKHDWLKISLVNRDEPSIVAIRRLQAEFRASATATADPVDAANNNNNQRPQPASPVEPPPRINPEIQTPVNNNNNSPPAADQPAENEVVNDPQQGGLVPQAPLQPPIQPQPQPQPQPDISLPPDQQNQAQPASYPPQRAPPAYQPADQPSDGYPAPAPPGQDLQPTASETHKSSTKPMRDADADPMTSSASEILSSTIKPVTPAAKKKPGWAWPGKRRRRRDTGGQPAPSSAIEAIVLTCQRSDDCEWQSDTKDEGIQWSLARMPSSTSTVQAGYYYVSNRNNYGDSSKLLRVSLNQTERATIADQNSDHCIDLAIYVTERTFLRMYRLTKTGVTDSSSSSASDTNEDSGWVKGNLLMSWAPTLAINGTQSIPSRVSLPGARLAAMEAGQNGWTMETLCFGDFFPSPKECGAGKCAFGFVMDDGRLSNQQLQHQQLQLQGDKAAAIEAAATSVNSDDATESAEQVVGVSILREHSQNIPIKPSRPRWLESWHRDEVEPADDWKFYPKLDYEISANNISLVNLFDKAHYFIESDWLHVDTNLDLVGTLLLEDRGPHNVSRFELPEIMQQQQQQQQHQALSENPGNIFTLNVKSKLVDTSFSSIFINETSFDWNIYSVSNGSSSISVNMSITDQLRSARGGELLRRAANRDDESDTSLFKIVFELVLDLRWLTTTTDSSKITEQYLHSDGGSRFRISLVNVSVSDRCQPNQCEHGSCQQNGTGLQDWNCRCDDKYRGRRCEFGHWCNVPHVMQWNPAAAIQQHQQGGQKSAGAPMIALKIHGNGPTANGNGPTIRQSKLNAGDSVIRVTGEQYCKSKLGPGYRCTDIDLPLNDNLFVDEDKTFYCSCKDDFYLSDDSRCRQTHACNSILCPSMGMICDETRPFNHTQPCHCNEKQDWFADPADPANRCVRRQCHDKRRDCGFDAHLCIPTLPGERPICKCGPKFALKSHVDRDEHGNSKKYCQSMACALPTLNDCQQICVPDNGNMSKPYTCACHPGFKLDPLDGRTCKPFAGTKAPHCRPACPSDSQICTEHGCRCKQGFVGEAEQKVRRIPRGQPKGQPSSASNATHIDYTESIRCLNICSLSYAENKEEFEMIESVCPLGLCDANTFQCKCSDPSSAALANEKYEPILANCSNSDGGDDDDDNVGDGDGGGLMRDSATGLVRVSPLCHLKRVCEPESSSHKICKSQGAICVPDYTKPAKFDCICPPSTEKRLYGQGTVGEFTCESKCNSKKSDCLRKQAVCKQIDRDQVRCDCLPGFMLQDNVCYLAKYSYSIELMVVNKYYEPEARFHRLIELNSTLPTTADARVTSDATTATRDAAHLCPRKKHRAAQAVESPHTEPNQDDQQPEPLSEIVPQFNMIEARTSSSSSAAAAAAAATTKMTKSIFIADYNQCNITQVIPKSVLEDPYEHDIESYLGYIEQCNEKIHQNMRNYHLNSRLGEDIRQSLRQHLREFTVITNNGSCTEADPSGMLLNCTIYLQSDEPIEESTVNYVFNGCEKNSPDNRYCWIKPRLLLLKRPTQHQAPADLSTRSAKTSQEVAASSQQFNFKQIVPCEVGNFCGPDAVSVRLDEKSSLCSCKCPADIEVIDVKDLEPRRQDDDPTKVAVKEICAPRNHCGGANSTHCIQKPGSVCQYDIRTGSKCICVYPAYEDSSGKCVEVAFSRLDSTLILIIIMLGTALLVSVCLNILVAARTKSMFGRSKQYPMNEFSSPPSRANMNNRSTGVPNPVFEND